AAAPAAAIWPPPADAPVTVRWGRPQVSASSTCSAPSLPSLPRRDTMKRLYLVALACAASAGVVEGLRTAAAPASRTSSHPDLQHRQARKHHRCSPLPHRAGVR